MNWSQIAPHGTAAWCNSWRSRYHEMPFAQHQADTDAIMLGHVTPEGHLIDSRDLRRCFSTINPSGRRVIEFGGWRGAMANAALNEFPWLAGWTNYDICPSAQVDSHCTDQRYECVVADDFLWRTPRPATGDIFASSHAIEHVTAEHLALLFAWLPDTIRWMYLCAPIPDSCTDNKWVDYGGTHILEIGWEQVLALLPDFRFVESGEQFRWIERK